MVFAGALCAPECHGQTTPLESAVTTESVRNPGERGDSRIVIEVTSVRAESFKRNEISPARFRKKQFVVLSVCVYVASLADMHQTMRVRKYGWWQEKDPVARPLVRLPAPAYYAAGLALATGVNWMSWKMGHSRRWHRLAFMPQLFSWWATAMGSRATAMRVTRARV